MTVYIIGGGTLAKVVIDLLESIDIEIGGLFDDNFPKLQTVLGYSVIGKIKDILPFHKHLAIAIGEPIERKKLYEKLRRSGYHFPKLIHRTAFISKHASIKKGAIIGPGCNILAETKVDVAACLLANVNLNQNVRLGAYSLVGAGANIGNNSQLGEGCHVGLGQIVSPNSIVEPWESLI